MESDLSYLLKTEEEAVVCKLIVLKLARPTTDGQVFSAHAFLPSGDEVESHTSISLFPNRQVRQVIEFGEPGGGWKLIFEAPCEIPKPEEPESRSSINGWDGKAMIWESRRPDPPSS